MRYDRGKHIYEQCPEGYAFYSVKLVGDKHEE